ncbi:hypothetical protein [Thalassospira sp.]|uniref:Bbp19 family protein n=1 Tax=Thalassospira sp. TaxID=1912094 RepID=UPI002733AA99|nr:hypothetical protein [Thalassospira sp.]MDP2697592.1 hypothetical protein [Thalassospira sp.]
MTGWHWFNPQMSDDPAADDAANVDQMRRKIWQRCLGGADGAVVLGDLRAMTLDRVLGPDAGDRALWMLEGQRALVLQMRQMAQGSERKNR